MANYATLKAAIQQVVKTNGNNEITGALLQQSLLAMINSLGADYQFVGIALPTTNPGTPDQNVAYICGSGTYPNFGNKTVASGLLGVLKFNGTWVLETIDTGTGDKLIKLVGMGTSPIPSGVTKTGDVYYNTNDKELKKCTNYSALTFETVPYYDGAIYTYNNSLYLWNGTDLINLLDSVYTYLNKVLPFLRGGLPMVLRSSNLQTETLVGVAVTPVLISEFLLDFKIDGPRTSGAIYGLYSLNFRVSGSSAQSNYIAVTKTVSGTTTTIGTMSFGQNAPTGKKSYDITLTSGNGVAHLYLDWDALINGPGGFTTFTFPGYDFDQDYIFDLSTGILADIKTKQDVATLLPLQQDVQELQNNFVVKTREIENTPIENTLIHSFSQYGQSFVLGQNLKISGLRVTIKAQSGSPVSRVKFSLRKNVRAGEIIAEKYVDVTIPAGTTKDVICTFDNAVSYSGIIFLALSFNTPADFLAMVDYTNYPYVPTDGSAQKPYQGTIFGSIDGTPSATNITRVAYVVIYTPVNTLNDAIMEDVAQQVSAKNVEISLPDKINAIVGDTLQLFYRGMIRSVDPYQFDILIKCAKGAQYPRYYQFTPVAGDVGTYPFELVVKDDNNNIVASKKITLNVAAAPSTPASSLNVCCFGDSLTQNGYWPAEAFRRLTGTGGTPDGKGLGNIHFCGQMQKDGAGYCGFGGWSWRGYVTNINVAFRFTVSGVTSVSYGAVYSNNGHNYTVIEVNVTSGSGTILCAANSASDTPSVSGTLTRVSGSGDSSISFSASAQDAANPLWDSSQNKMTFVNYANTYCNGQINVVYTLLSWNALRNWQEDFTTILGYIQTFADTLHSEFPNAKLKILGLQVPSVNGGFGANYGTNENGDNYSDAFGMLATAMNMNAAYQDFANQDNYKTFVEFVNLMSQFDSENNMPKSERPVNTRNSETEIVGTNAIHPADSGYMQIADVVYRNFVASFCQ